MAKKPKPIKVPVCTYGMPCVGALPKTPGYYGPHHCQFCAAAVDAVKP